MQTEQYIIDIIDKSPMNRGLEGRAWLLTTGNIPIVFDNGDVALFDCEGEDIYEGHLMFVSRGREAIEHARQAFDRMFTKFGAKMIFGLVPETRREAKMVVRWVGGKSRGLRNTPHGWCELFVLSKIMWQGSQQ